MQARASLSAEVGEARSTLQRERAELEAGLGAAEAARAASEEAARRLADRAAAMLAQEDGMAKREVGQE